MRPQRSMGSGGKCLQTRSGGKIHFLLSAEAWVMPAPSSSDNSSTPEHRCTCREQEHLNSSDLDTFQKSRSPITVVTANGEVHKIEEAQVYDLNLDLFVTVQLLETRLPSCD